MKNFIEKKYRLIVGIIIAFMAVVSLLNAWNDSAIFDETAHIGASYSYVTQHEMRLNPEHPPLLKDLAGLSALIFAHPRFDVAGQAFWDGTLPNKWDEGQWAAGRYLLYQSGNNPDQIIFWARFPIVILSLIFGLFIFKWGKELAGTMAGIFALALYAFDPNILGHNHFVTTDLGIAAFFTFAFYFYLKFIKHPNWKNIIWAGIFLGLLLLTKFSFLIAFPIIGLATLIYPFVALVPEKNGWLSFRLKKFVEYIGKGALVFAISLAVVWIFYAANTFRMGREIVAQSIDNNFSLADTNVKNVYTNKALHWLNANSVTRPYTEFGIGVAYVFRRVSGGNGAYFMGQVSSTAFPAYFPTVFLIKESLPSLFLMIFALMLGIARAALTFSKTFDAFFKKNLQNISHYLRTHIVEFSLILFIALYAYVSITGNLNIGFRHLFPILPFIYLLTAKVIANLLKNKVPRHAAVSSLGHNSPQAIELARQEAREDHRIKIFSISFFILFGYMIIGTIIAYPYYMSYFNETAGGPKNGYRYVTDSNADWGQDLKRLRNFLNSHPDIGKIRFDYFGGGDISAYIGDKYIQWWDSKRPIEPGWYAVSTNFLMGSLYDTKKPDSESYRWLKNKKPVSQVGTSILIYYVTPEESANY